MIIKRSIAGLIILLVVLAAAIPLQVSLAQNISGQKPTAGVRVAADNTCQAILARALSTLQDTCSAVSRNTACYGNNNVQVEASNAASLKFDTVGDMASIKSIKTLFTTPLDTDKGTWGLSLLKLQANIPDSLPGQNVIFLVYGDTKLENTSGDMQAFYFSSGLGTPSCKEAPHDGILVKSPQHTEITFTANGAQVTIASAVDMTSEPGKSMKIHVMDGHARVTSDGISKVAQSGESITVPMGGSNGLTASGAPSDPEKETDDSALSNLNSTTDKAVDPDAGVNETIVGCISAVQGNHITVNDQDINVGSDHILKAAKVGDCVEISGAVVKDNNGNGKEFKLVKATNHGNNGGGNNGNGNGNGNGKDKDKDKGDMGNGGDNGGMGGGNGGGNGGMGNGK